VVLSYTGSTQFLKSLRRSLNTYGGLTYNQVRSLMSPPPADEVQMLRDYGLEVPAHAWEARERINAIIREAATRARVELATEALESVEVVANLPHHPVGSGHDTEQL
jgi:hypothetical protein